MVVDVFSLATEADSSINMIFVRVQCCCNEASELTFPKHYRRRVEKFPLIYL